MLRLPIALMLSAIASVIIVTYVSAESTVPLIPLTHDAGIDGSSVSSTDSRAKILVLEVEDSRKIAPLAESTVSKCVRYKKLTSKSSPGNVDLAFGEDFNNKSNYASAVMQISSSTSLRPSPTSLRSSSTSPTENCLQITDLILLRSGLWYKILYFSDNGRDIPQLRLVGAIKDILPEQDELVRAEFFVDQLLANDESISIRKCRGRCLSYHRTFVRRSRSTPGKPAHEEALDGLRQLSEGRIIQGDFDALLYSMIAAYVDGEAELETANLRVCPDTNKNSWHLIHETEPSKPEWVLHCNKLPSARSSQQLTDQVTIQLQKLSRIQNVDLPVKCEKHVTYSLASTEGVALSYNIIALYGDKAASPSLQKPCSTSTNTRGVNNYLFRRPVSLKEIAILTLEEYASTPVELTMPALSDIVELYEEREYSGSKLLNIHLKLRTNFGYDMRLIPHLPPEISCVSGSDQKSIRCQREESEWDLNMKQITLLLPFKLKS